ncbi:hypothetical protein B0J11DRAFT_550022 [Dendryphion nanum]|uniref:Uncharacterized protein n=1 Tax=Dendryphion nanum TaxID=256645 RepID=A0A9P9DV94_9PLEO|nr:hypothetical protein B0J11DRAFT_550022 [Dendryphion nanum]
MVDMDTNMMDVDYDIEIDADPGIDVLQVQEPTLTVQHAQVSNGTDEKPAAYYESLEVLAPVPELLNLQGVDQFGPNAPMDYALEYYPQAKPSHIRWINDNSCNLEFENARDAADALAALTHPDEGDAANIPAQTSRKAQYYSGQPGSELMIREANTGDQKQRNAAQRSRYYKENPQLKERDRERGERGRRRPHYLDYDEVDTNKKSFDESMYDDPPTSNIDTGRARRQQNPDRRDRGRQDRDVDSYRPGSSRYAQRNFDYSRDSPRESRFGRLRGRSASPGADGDGRYGFAEEGFGGHRYRSRSRGDRRRRSGSRTRDWDRERVREHDRDRDYRRQENPRWEHDRAIVFTESGRWAKTPSGPPHKPETKIHRRSDATDETRNKGSLLSRMTKNGKPLVPTRSLASRITRDDDESNYGRLKDDDSAPREDSFQEPMKTKRDLASRITWSRDKGDDQDIGFNIRGTAPQAEGFSIRGAAGGS